MHNVCAGRFEYLDLVAVEMNAMCQCDVTTSQAETVEVRNVTQPAFLLDQLTFGPVLRSVRMDHHATLARQTRNSREQITRATDRKPRRETITYATTITPVPLIKQRK